MCQGEFICLAPKSYIAFDSKTTESKLGLKGISNRDGIDLEVFREVLYTNSNHKVECQTLQMKDSKMSRIQTLKESCPKKFISIK